MSLAQDLTRLYTEITGTLPGPTLASTVADVLSKCHFSVEEPLPAYLGDGLQQLARRELTVGWNDVALEDSGMSFILGELAPLLPGAMFDQQEHRAELVIPAVGVKLIVEALDGQERWAVVPFVAEPPSDGGEQRLIVLNTSSPTSDQLHRWAYDRRVLLRDQDETDILDGDLYLSQLAEFVADPACPRVPDIISILDETVIRGVRNHGMQALGRIAKVRTPAEKRAQNGLSVPRETQQWLSALSHLEAYVVATGMVIEPEAYSIARHLQIGWHSIGHIMSMTKRDQWWEFPAGAPGKPPSTVLYIHELTGRLHLANKRLSDLELARVQTPAKRMD